MTIHVTTRLVNGADTTYPRIDIRKFYQVLFISEDLKDVDLYTCIVVRARDAHGLIKALGTDFDLRVQIGIGDGVTHPPTPLPNANDCLSEFRKEITPWQYMWGSNCAAGEDITERDIQQALRSHVTTVGEAKMFGFAALTVNAAGSQLPDSGPIDLNIAPATSLIGQMKHHRVIVLRGGAGADTDQNFSICLPATGSQLLQGSGSYPSTETLMLEYRIERPQDWIEGCDLISWKHIRIPVNRKHPLPHAGPSVELSWIFDAPPNKERIDAFSCEEMRIYVVPPVHKRLAHDNSILRYSTDTERHEEDRIPNKNALDEMVPDPNVYFSQWEREQHTSSRVVYRIRGAEFESPNNNYRRFTFISKISAPRRLDPKLLASILIPIIAAFGIDSNRLKDIGISAAAHLASPYPILDGTFPYWSLFSPLHCWVALLVGITFQALLDLSWRNDRRPKHWIFRVASIVSYVAAIIWFVPTFIFGIDEIIHLWLLGPIMGPLLRWAWTVAVIVPALSVLITFLFFPDRYHFGGVGQNLRRSIERHLRGQAKVQ